MAYFINPIISMKRKVISSRRRSKTETGAGAKDRPVLFPWPPQPRGGRPSGRSPELQRCWSGRPATTHTSRRRGKRRAGNPAHKDVKNEGRTDYVYGNKGPNDNMPDKKDYISAYLEALLNRSTHISAETLGLLPFAEFPNLLCRAQGLQAVGAGVFICPDPSSATGANQRGCRRLRACPVCER